MFVVVDSGDVFRLSDLIDDFPLYGSLHSSGPFDSLFVHTTGVSLFEESGLKLSNFFVNADELGVLALDISDPSSDLAVKFGFFGVFPDQVNLSLEDVDSGTPSVDGKLDVLSAALLSALAVLNHDHKTVDLVLLIKVGAHVAFNYKSIKLSFVSSDVSLDVEVMLFTLELHGLELTELVSLCADDGEHGGELLLVHSDEFVVGAHGGIDGQLQALNLTV